MKLSYCILFLMTLFMPLAAKEVFSFGRNVPWQKSSPSGNFSISKDNILSLDGKTAEVDIDAKLNNPEKGITLMAVVKLENLPNLSEEEKTHEAIFYRNRQFVMGIYSGQRFYVNFHDGKKWFAPQFVKIKYDDNQYHSYAMTVERINIKEQGIDYLEVRIYFDGRLVTRTNIPGGSVADSTSDLNLGHAKGFGEVWHLGGNIIDARGYNRVLPDAEIERYTAQFKEIENQSRSIYHLSSADQEQINSMASSGSAEVRSAVSAVRNLALKTTKFNWRKAAAVLKNSEVNTKTLEANGLYQYKLDGTILTVATANGYADAVSFFDTVNNRELLRYDNPFFHYWINGDKFSSVDSDVVSEFEKINDRKFVLRYKFKNASATLNFDCCGKSINYSLNAVPAKKVSFDNVDFPVLKINNLSSEAALFAPVMSGVEYPAACSNLTNYEELYPQARATMQYGAFYDAKGGLFWSPADPLARPKMIFFHAKTDHLNIAYQWYPRPDSAFDPGCSARLELFKGNWFEAAMIYKQLLTNMDALYWIKHPLPRRDSPEWLKNNTLWLLGTQYKPEEAAQYKKLRDYLGMPFAVHMYYWNSKVYDRDYPHHSGLASFLDLIAKCHSMGLRIVPYINGRLWEFQDRREEDYLFTKLGKPNLVHYKDGSVATSVFNKKTFGIICPYTPVFEEMMRKSSFMLGGMGTDGVYVDQIGAARHLMCYNKNHGHATPDDTIWFLNGHHKVFSKIRSEIQARNPEFILSTEDNAETCVRNFDALLTWRWIINEQVPAFPAVYAGRVQFVGLNYDTKTDAEASFAKAAWQLIVGGQIGWFVKDYICHPDKHDFRVWVKQLMRLRLSLLPFFNEGAMDTPAKFANPIKTKKLFWGHQRSRLIDTPDIYSTSWKYNGAKAVILINTTADKVANKITFDSVKNGKLYIFDNSNKEKIVDCNGIFEYNFNLNPRSFQLLLAVPDDFKEESLISSVRAQFGIIASIPSEYDPFERDLKKIADYNPLSMITVINTGKFGCQFFARAMYPNAFTLHDGTELDAVKFNDRIKIGKDVYYLDCERWAERKVIEDTQDRFVIKMQGTFCTSRHEYAAKDVKAVYRYTFKRNSAEIEVEARVSLPQDIIAEPELLELECSSKNPRISWSCGNLENQQKIFIRKGKIFIK